MFDIIGGISVIKSSLNTGRVYYYGIRYGNVNELYGNKFNYFL